MITRNIAHVTVDMPARRTKRVRLGLWLVHLGAKIAGLHIKGV